LSPSPPQNAFIPSPPNNPQRDGNLNPMNPRMLLHPVWHLSINLRHNLFINSPCHVPTKAQQL